VLWLAAYSSIAGGVFAVVLGLMRGYLRTAVRNVLNLVQFWWLTGFRPHPEVTLERGTGPRLAYAIPIFIGTAGDTMGCDNSLCPGATAGTTMAPS
jgi:hypothetical protein